MASGHGLSSDDHDDADVDADPTAGGQGIQCGGLRLTPVRGVPLAGAAQGVAAPQIKPRFNLPGSPNETGPKNIPILRKNPQTRHSRFFALPTDAC